MIQAASASGVKPMIAAILMTFSVDGKLSNATAVTDRVQAVPSTAPRPLMIADLGHLLSFRDQALDRDTFAPFGIWDVAAIGIFQEV